MTEHFARPCTAFAGHRLLASGPLAEVALAVKAAGERKGAHPILVFDDTTGRIIDLDLRGTKADITARLSQVEERHSVGAARSGELAAEPRGRGRPKLGVIGREVTLLPRHWEWLAAQPGGASVALRKLVDDARRSGAGLQRRRAAQEAAYHVMHALAGDLPGFEEATRALFANDPLRFEQHVKSWPRDLRAYATRLAFAATAEDQADP